MDLRLTRIDNPEEHILDQTVSCYILHEAGEGMGSKDSLTFRWYHPGSRHGEGVTLNITKKDVVILVQRMLNQ